MIDKEANIITHSEAFSLSGNGFLHIGQNAGFFQTVNQNRRNNRAAGSGNKEWNDVSVKSNPGRTLPHEKHGYQVGAQAIAWAEQYRAQNVDHVLHGRALAPENRERKHATYDSNGAQDAGNR